MNTHTITARTSMVACSALLVVALTAGVPLISYSSVDNTIRGCRTMRVLTVVSGTTTMVVGNGTAIAVIPSAAWTASIASSTTWIWQAGRTLPDAVVVFEKSFTTTGATLSAQFDIATNHRYTAFIDGVKIAADFSTMNATRATQDSYNIAASVKPGTHTLRIETAAIGSFSALNLEGLLYKLKVETCIVPKSNMQAGSISVIARNRGTMETGTYSYSVTGRNTVSPSTPSNSSGQVGSPQADSAPSNSSGQAGSPQANSGSSGSIQSSIGKIVRGVSNNNGGTTAGVSGTGSASPSTDSAPSNSSGQVGSPQAGSTPSNSSGQVSSSPLQDSGGQAESSNSANPLVDVRSSSRGGRITTGNAASTAITTNVLNEVRVRVSSR